MNFDNKFNQIRNNIINFLSVTNEEKEKSKKSIYYKIIVFLKTNKFKLGSIILILLCWYYFCNLFNENSNHKILNIQIGGAEEGEGEKNKKPGFFRKYYDKRMDAKKKYFSSKAQSFKSGIAAAPGRMKDFAGRKVGQFKAVSGTIYKLLFQIALVVMMFIILGPTLAIGFAMIVCYALLKKKIMYIKEL